MSRVLIAAAFIGTTMIGLQFTGPAHTNPATDASLDLERVETVPADVARTLRLACRDCHSNETKWRWYTYLAPLSWWTVGHVNAGRDELNFSRWGNYGQRMRETRLHAICGLTRKGKMPLPAYARAHSEARITEAEIDALCAWTSRPRR